jgi:hypothetical protein
MSADDASGRVYLDPSGERAPADGQGRASASLDSQIGLVDISVPRGDVFPIGSSRQLRFSKPTFTKPAPIDLRHQISTQCDVVIQALAD